VVRDDATRNSGEGQDAAGSATARGDHTDAAGPAISGARSNAVWADELPWNDVRTGDFELLTTVDEHGAVPPSTAVVPAARPTAPRRIKVPRRAFAVVVFAVAAVLLVGVAVAATNGSGPEKREAAAPPAGRRTAMVAYPPVVTDPTATADPTATGDPAATDNPATTGAAAPPAVGGAAPVLAGTVPTGAPTRRASGPAAAPTTRPPTTQPHVAAAQPAGPTGRITSHQGKCLHIAYTNSSDGTQVEMYTCNDGSAESWTMASDGTVRALGKCLDVEANSTADGARVQLYTCNGGANQQWRFSPGDDIVNPQAHKCLDITGMGTGNGVPVQLWTCTGTTNQKWSVP
jgi:hypothetical protein